jgi:hypothetical protein
MGRGRGKERRGEERWIRREGGDPRGGGEEKEERRGEERKGEGEGTLFRKNKKNHNTKIFRDILLSCYSSPLRKKKYEDSTLPSYPRDIG